MKKIILILLIALVSLSWAQPRRPVQWRDLQEAVKDSIRNASGGIGDSLTVLRAELGDSINVYIADSLNNLSGSNGVLYSVRDFSLIDDSVGAKVFDEYLRSNEYSYRYDLRTNTNTHFHPSAIYTRRNYEVARASSFLTSALISRIWVFIGNSITRQIRGAYFEMIEHKFGFAGLGFDPFADLAYGSRVTVNSKIAKEYNNESNQIRWGIGGNSVYLVTGDSIEYTPIFPYGRFTDVRIWYAQKSGGGDFDYSIDGGAATTVNTVGATALKAVRITGLSGNTDHYVTINNIVTSTDSVTLYGIETWQDTLNSGLIPEFLASSGSITGNWVAAMDFYRTFFDSIQPSHTSIYLGANDGASGKSGSVYSTNMSLLIDTLQAIDPYMDIVLYTQYDRGKDADWTVKDTTISNYFVVYRDTLFQIADRKNCSVFDLRSYWPEHAEGIAQNLYDNSDVIHPSTAGENMIAQGWSEFVPHEKVGYALRDLPNFFRDRQGFYYGAESTPGIVFWARAGSSQPTLDNTGFWTTNGDVWFWSYNGTRRISYGGNGIASRTITVFPTAALPYVLSSMRHSSTTAEAWQIQTNATHQEVHTAGRVVFDNEISIGGGNQIDSTSVNDDNSAWFIDSGGTKYFAIKADSVVTAADSLRIYLGTKHLGLKWYDNP